MTINVRYRGHTATRLRIYTSLSPEGLDAGREEQGTRGRRTYVGRHSDQTTHHPVGSSPSSECPSQMC